jgi:hypothetical protein
MLNQLAIIIFIYPECLKLCQSHQLYWTAFYSLNHSPDAYSTLWILRTNSIKTKISSFIPCTVINMQRFSQLLPDSTLTCSTPFPLTSIYLNFFLYISSFSWIVLGTESKKSISHGFPIRIFMSFLNQKEKDDFIKSVF